MKTRGKRFESANAETAKPMRVREVTMTEFRRISTKLPEFDRLLGGGIVSGSLTLIGGDPGIGKSTLMLQLAQNLAEQGLTLSSTFAAKNRSNKHRSGLAAWALPMKISIFSAILSFPTSRRKWRSSNPMR